MLSIYTKKIYFLYRVVELNMNANKISKSKAIKYESKEMKCEDANESAQKMCI